MTRRTERIAAQLQAEIARILREEVTDPRVGLVTLTRVDVSPELSNAVVFYSVLQEEVESVDEGLRSASGFVRSRVAQALSLKRVPELRFRYDPSLSLGTRTLGVLRSLGDVEDA